ncbi:MAG TPA: hypothetical protein VII48_05975, partial [Rhizomicrobium sp.]
DLGPEGGEGGGRIVAQGAPELVARSKESHTGQFLARYYEGAGSGTAETALPPAQLQELAAKPAKSRRSAPEKKTGVPTASKMKPEPRAATKGAKKKRAARTKGPERELVSTR